MQVMINPQTAYVFDRTYNDYRNLFTVSSNGDIAPEDSLKGGVAAFSEPGYNVKTHSLNDLTQSYFWKELEEASHKAPENCMGCKWWRVCRGGKLINRYSIKNGFDNSSIYCSALKRYYREVYDFLIRIGYKNNDIDAHLTDPINSLVSDDFVKHYANISHSEI